MKNSQLVLPGLGLVLLWVISAAADYGTMNRLPNTTIPFHYDMDLEVKLEPEFTFHGNVTIDFIQTRPTKTIVLHSNNLTIGKDNSFLVDKERNKVQFFRIVDNFKSNNFLVLKFENILNEGVYSLRLQFRGVMGNKSKGLYMTSYRKDRWMASTQFEPTDARRMFPCFDEPQYKATFDLRVIHPKDRSAISNTAIANVMQAGDKKMSSFKRTPLMSTYLLALAITDYDYVESEFKHKKYRLYVDPKLINYTLLAQDTTLKAVDLLESQLGVDYSLGKLDQIVVPTFSGGMENWGMIVYGESVIFKPNSSSERKRLNLVNLVAHELAHQWFGNLVTCQWWSYIWLNEGFATYYGHLVTDTIESDQRIMEKHIVNEIRNIMVPDSKVDAAEALNREVDAVFEIFPKFNFIGYTKGSAIIYFMASAFENFNSSITNYLMMNAFKSVIPESLYSAIDRTNKMPYNATAFDILSTWTDQAGFPVVTLTIDYDKNVALITQKRFIISTSSVKSDEKWWIPITMSTESHQDFENTNPIDWIRPEDEGTVIKIRNTSSWVLLNHKSSIYGRINYDPTNWKRITDYLNGSDYQNIHSINRAQVVDDALNLARAGEIPYEIALNLTTYLKQEEDVVVWSGVQASLVFLNFILIGTPIHYKFLDYISHLSVKAKTRGLQSVKKEFSFDRDIIEEFNKKFNKIKSKNMKGKQKQLHKVFSLLSDNIFDKDDYTKVKELFETKIEAMDDMESDVSKETLKKIQNNIDYKAWWVGQYYKDIERWLKERSFA